MTDTRFVHLVLGCLLATAHTSPAAAICGGDCSGDGNVTINEVITCVNIGLGLLPVSQCAVADTSGDGSVAINEVIGAVNNGLVGCPGDFAGDYAGNAPLNAGTTAAIDLSVAANGDVMGSLSVVESLQTRSPRLHFGLITVDLDGIANPQTGAFQVSGSFVDGNGTTVPIRITGTLPPPIGTSSFTLEAGDETFHGTLAPADAPPATPTSVPTRTPTPGSVATPTTDGHPTPAPGCGGGYAHVDLSAISGANLEEPQTSYEMTKGGGNLILFNQAILGANVAKCPVEAFGVTRVLEISLYADGPQFTPGHMFNLNETTPGALVANSCLYREGTAGPSLKTWMADSGTATIDAVDGNQVSLHVNAHMVPGPAFPFGLPAMGSFTLNSNLTAEVMVIRP